MQTIGPEYDHIDFYDGEETVRHYLKDPVSRAAIDDINSRMLHNIKDGSGDGAVVENHLEATSEEDIPNQASGIYSHAEGQSTDASGQAAHAEGSSTSATSVASHAEGNGSIASGLNAHAEGRNTRAVSDSAHAEGSASMAQGEHSHAEGFSTSAIGENSHAEGKNTIASGPSTHAGGMGTIAGSRSQHVFGEYNIAENGAASERGGHIEIVGNGADDGHRSNARTLDWSGNEELCGHITIDKGTADEAEITGRRWNEIPQNVRDGSGVGAVVSNDVINEASGDYSSAAGYGVRSAGDYAHSEGRETVASGDCAHAEGRATAASGSCSHAEGEHTSATAPNSHASGSGTEAHGPNSVACGAGVITDHADQFVFGAYNEADPSELSAASHGIYVEMVGNGQSDSLRSNARTLDWQGNERISGSLTIGAGSANEAVLQPEELNTMKLDISSIKLIINNVPKNSRDGTGKGSVVIASDAPSRASGENAVAESSGNASGRNSHAEGNGSLAQGAYSHAEGYNTTAGGIGAHAQGYSAVANGEYSHAEGYGTIASGQHQHVAGKWNLPDPQKAEVIGNGAANSRSNARTLDWDGNEVLAGGLTTGGDVVANGVSLAALAENAVNEDMLLTDYRLMKYGDISTAWLTDNRILPGQYFTVSQYFFRATDTIPQGGSVIPGTNCVFADVGDVLNALNTDVVPYVEDAKKEYYATHFWGGGIGQTSSTVDTLLITRSYHSFTINGTLDRSATTDGEYFIALSNQASKCQKFDRGDAVIDPFIRLENESYYNIVSRINRGTVSENIELSLCIISHLRHQSIGNLGSTRLLKGNGATEAFFALRIYIPEGQSATFNSFSFSLLVSKAHHLFDGSLTIGAGTEDEATITPAQLKALLALLS